MMDTDNLIANLSAQAKPTKKIRKPSYWVVRLLVLLAIYTVGCQLFLGFRADLMVQFARPLFVLEILLLSLLLLSSTFASVLSMYPDAHQKHQFLKIPYVIFTILVMLMGIQFFMPLDTRMVMSSAGLNGDHAMECAICIASIALIPSALIFALLRQGASVRQLQAGSFAVLAASSIGCLTIRLSEANDSIMHLVQWHYIPTLFFAALGAMAGKWLLKW
jgi:hypothetical protein